jgi:predicted ATP-dependent endonuclease of OLD family
VTGSPVALASSHVHNGGVTSRAVVFVEGISDRLAIETLAARRSRDLEAEGVRVIPIGGAHALGKALRRVDHDVRVAGLCDAGEEEAFARALDASGFGHALDRDALEALGFYVCEADLEDELVRALGSTRVAEIIEAQGETSRFRTFQKQLEKRELSLAQQLHGFMWNRKIRYAPLLVEALELDRVPRPLDNVLAHVMT